MQKEMIVTSNGHETQVAILEEDLVTEMFVERERQRAAADLRDRVIALVGQRQLADTTRAFDDAGTRISRYLLMQLMINTGFGCAVAIGLWAIGVPYALLWGFFAVILRYIPYLGPWLAATLPIAMSLLISRDWMVALQVIALFGALELITNMLIEPTLYGRGIGVSQAALLVAVAFWTWFWGPVGLVLASPLTVRATSTQPPVDQLLGSMPVRATAAMCWRGADEKHGQGGELAIGTQVDDFHGVVETRRRQNCRLHA